MSDCKHPSHNPPLDVKTSNQEKWTCPECGNVAILKIGDRELSRPSGLSYWPIMAPSGCYICR